MMAFQVEYIVFIFKIEHYLQMMVLVGEKLYKFRRLPLTKYISSDKIPAKNTKLCKNFKDA